MELDVKFDFVVDMFVFWDILVFIYICLFESCYDVWVCWVIRYDCWVIRYDIWFDFWSGVWCLGWICGCVCGLLDVFNCVVFRNKIGIVSFELVYFFFIDNFFEFGYEFCGIVRV